MYGRASDLRRMLSVALRSQTLPPPPKKNVTTHQLNTDRKR